MKEIMFDDRLFLVPDVIINISDGENFEWGNYCFHHRDLTGYVDICFSTVPHGAWANEYKQRRFGEEKVWVPAWCTDLAVHNEYIWASNWDLECQLPVGVYRGL